MSHCVRLLSSWGLERRTTRGRDAADCGMAGENWLGADGPAFGGSKTVRLTSGSKARAKPVPALGVPLLPTFLDVRKRQRLSPQWLLAEHRRVSMNLGWLQIHRASLDLGVQQGRAFRPVV
jgi:hypothetical protein